MPLKTAHSPSLSLKVYGRGCLSDTWMMVLKQRRSLCLDAANLEVEEVWQKREMRNKRRALLFRHNSACPAQSVYCWKREGRATFRISCRSSAIIEEPQSFVGIDSFYESWRGERMEKHKGKRRGFVSRTWERAADFSGGIGDTAFLWTISLCIF